MLTTVFRFMDTAKRGNLSKEEWALLYSIWSELWASTRDFKRRAEECFGSLEAAWVYAMAGSQKLLLFANFERLAVDIHFDGPARQIFLLLDQDADEKVTRADWLSCFSSIGT